MINRILYHLNNIEFFNKNQYGFRQGYNTTNAASAVLIYINHSKRLNCHTAIVSIDYCGAFDNAWHPAILKNLKDSNYPRNLYLLLASCFTNRKVSVQTKTNFLCIISDRGCPQGSCLGPALWNILYNNLLTLQDRLPSGFVFQCFVDDTLLLVRYQNRDQLE